VARTGALVAAAPLVGAIAAAVLLDEPLGLLTVVGVLVVIAGVAVLSFSMRNSTEGSRVPRLPWHALTVAGLWGLSPILIRRGLEGLPDPVLGLTFGLGVTVVIYGLGLTVARGWGPRVPSPKITGPVVAWTVLGGLTGAVAISAQWISFELTTIAIALSLQQMAVLVVLALAPLMFPEPIERVNTLLLVGTAAMLAGTTLVVLQRF
jgi:drug/metabolite transporter (DMT)-like permease